MKVRVSSAQRSSCRDRTCTHNVGGTVGGPLCVRIVVRADVCRCAHVSPCACVCVCVCVCANALHRTMRHHGPRPQPHTHAGHRELDSSTTLDRWTPRDRCTPEHAAQMRMPRLMLAHSGAGARQSAQTSLPTTSRSVAGSCRAGVGVCVCVYDGFLVCVCVSVCLRWS